MSMFARATSPLDLLPDWNAIARQAKDAPGKPDGLDAEHVMNVMHGLMEHQERRERMLGRRNGA